MFDASKWVSGPRKALTKGGVRLQPSGKAPRPPHFWYVFKVPQPERFVAHAGSPDLVLTIDPEQCRDRAIMLGISRRGSAHSVYHVLGPRVAGVRSYGRDWSTR